MYYILLLFFKSASEVDTIHITATTDCVLSLALVRVLGTPAVLEIATIRPGGILPHEHPVRLQTRVCVVSPLLPVIE